MDKYAQTTNVPPSEIITKPNDWWVCGTYRDYPGRSLRLPAERYFSMGRAGGAPRSSDSSVSRQGPVGTWWKLGFGSLVTKVILGLGPAPSHAPLGLGTLGVLGARARMLDVLVLVAEAPTLAAPVQTRGRRVAAMLVRTRVSGAGLVLLSGG